MWYPATITLPAAAEPITTAEAKAHLRVDHSAEDSLIAGLVSAARAHVEAYCSIRFGTQTIAVKCDHFDDLARLPDAPVQSITSIAYVDTAGDSQTLSNTVYELRSDGIEAGVVLKYDQRWPTPRPGSRITVTAVVGFTATPADIKQALLLIVGHLHANREAVVTGTIATELPLGVDSLLANHRRGV